MGNLIDLTGVKFGGWVVIGRAPTRPPTTYWKCRCIYGRVQEIPSQNLRNGITSHCRWCARGLR